MNTLWFIRSEAPGESCIGECQCVLTRPGVTRRSRASMMRAVADATMSDRIAAMRPAFDQDVGWPGASGQHPRGLADQEVSSCVGRSLRSPTR
jgi:hypothetical protein